MENSHAQLRKDHEDTRAKVNKTEDRLNSVAEQIGKLATRDDLDRLGERMQTALTTSIGQILAFLGKREH